MNMTKPTHNLMSNLGITSTQDKTVKVGDGATVCFDFDRHAGTVTHYDAENKVVIVQQDKATRTDDNGESQYQTYEYEADESGTTWTFKRFKNMWEPIEISPRSGRYVRVPRSKQGLILGERSEYKEFNPVEYSVPNAGNQNDDTKETHRVASKRSKK